MEYPASLDASLRLLQFYAEISGLEINLEKTNVIWIGSKKQSGQNMCQVGTEMGLQYIYYYQNFNHIKIESFAFSHPRTRWEFDTPTEQ